MKLLLIIIAALLALAVWEGIEEQKEWERFMSAHHCRQVIDASASRYERTGYTDG